jgi:SRSO17 transposase
VAHNQDAAAAAATISDGVYSQLRDDLRARVAGCFRRRESRQACEDMVDGLLMELEDHNCWSIAEAVGHCGPHRLQHLLSRAVWNEQRAVDAAAGWAVEQLGDQDAVLIVDETADAKSSTNAVGAARQYSGTLGQVALCQVMVTLTYLASGGHTLIDRALYLPKRCAADDEHRELAGIGDEVAFATKPALAGALLARARSRGIDAAVVAGDEVYGGCDLRRQVRELGMGYVLAVRTNHAVTTGDGRTRTAAEAIKLIGQNTWQRMRTGSGTKGIRHYDWAMLNIRADDTPDGHADGHSVLLVRRHRYTRTVSFYRCFTPGPVPLSRLIAIAVARWRIEEDHQLAKQVSGLDSGQVIRWTSWHRWSALCLIAYMFLAVATARQRRNDTRTNADPDLVPITIPELLRLLRDTVIPPRQLDRPHRTAWSHWRRRHQYRARQAHQAWNAYAAATP